MFGPAVNVQPAEAVNRMAKLRDLASRETARMQETQKRLNLLTDNWSDQVTDRIRGRVKTETLEKLQLYLTIKDNPYKKIIGRLSKAYSEDPARSFPDSSVTEAARHAEWYGEKGINQVLEKAQQYMNATNDLLIYMQLIDGEIEPCLLTGNVTIVIGSEERPTIPEAVFIRYLKNEKDTATEENTYWVVWTESEHFIIDTGGAAMPIGDNSDMVNPWGVMPFVYLHRTLPVDVFFDETTGEDLVDLALDIGTDDTMDNYSRFLSGFKQAAVVGEFEDPPPGLLLNPDNLVAIHGTEVELQVLDWQLDLEKLEKDKRNKKERTLRNYGIGAGTGEATQEKSGIALAMESAELMELREDQIKIFTRAEEELFQLKLKIESVMKGASAPPNEVLSITFPEPEVYIAPEVELKIQTDEITAGLSSIVDVYMDRYQEPDRDKAIEALLRIQKENDMFTDSVIMNELNSPETVEKKEPE